MADISLAPKRRLPFPVDFAASITSLIPTIHDGEVSEFVWASSDPEERVHITLEVSLNEYVALASALDVGSDIAYSTDEFLIWFIWCRAVNPMALCAQMITCINTDPDVQSALTNFFQSSGLIDPNTVEPDATTIPDRFAGKGMLLSDDINTLDGCDLDLLWGGIREGIVRYLDDTARSFLDDLVVSADKGQRAQALIEAIPVVGSLAGAVVQQFVELAPDLLNLFNAYSSIDALDEIACGLFELVCAECRFPTYEEVFHYYASAGISGIDDVTNLVLLAATDLLLNSNQLAALACYHTIITYQLFILYLGSTFQGYSGTQAIALWSGIGQDDGSDNWIALCDGCEPASSTPVIAVTNACGMFGTTVFGSLATQGGVTWQGTSENQVATGVRYLTVQRADGGAFKLSNGSLISGTQPNFYAYHVAGNPICGSGFTEPDLNQNFTFFAWAFDGANFVIQFDFVDQ